MMGTTFPFDSVHPRTHRIVQIAFTRNSMIHRDYCIPLSEIDLKNDFSLIQSARQNGLKASINELEQKRGTKKIAYTFIKYFAFKFGFIIGLLVIIPK